MVKAIIFDWHGVLDKKKFADVYTLVSQYKNIPLDSIKNQLKQNKNDFATNKISPEQFWNNLQITFELTTDELTKVKKHILTPKKNQKIWNILKKLKKKYYLVILSDCSKDKSEVIRKTIDLSLFDKIYFSGETGFSKKNPEYFNTVLKELKLQAGECIFIDDTKENIDSAISVGLQTILYTDTKLLDNL